MSAPTLERPTTIGWWWRIDPEWGTRDCVEVTSLERGPYGGWICEVPTPERIAADAERLERVSRALSDLGRAIDDGHPAYVLRKVALRAIESVKP